MERKKEERKVYVMIRSRAEHKPVKLETWRYWEIVGELISMHAERQAAYDAARWCARMAKRGDRLEIAPDISLALHLFHLFFLLMLPLML